MTVIYKLRTEKTKKRCQVCFLDVGRLDPLIKILGSKHDLFFNLSDVSPGARARVVCNKIGDMRWKRWNERMDGRVDVR